MRKEEVDMSRLYEQSVMARVGDSIKKIREWHNVSQSQISKMLGITFQQVRKYEKNLSDIPVSKIYNICNIFNINASDLTSNDNVTGNFNPDCASLDKSEITKIIGNKIRKIRIWNSVTQKELADALNITFQQIQKYEKGKGDIKFSKILAIADHIKVSVDIFFESEYESKYFIVQNPQNFAVHEKKEKVDYDESYDIIKDQIKQIKNKGDIKSLIKILEAIQED